MYDVYILYSKKDCKLYVGQTNNLRQRLKKHNSGFIASTKNRRPLILIHHEIFKTRAEAMKREKFLKSLWGGRIKKKIKSEYLKKIRG